MLPETRSAKVLARAIICCSGMTLVPRRSGTIPLGDLVKIGLPGENSVLATFGSSVANGMELARVTASMAWLSIVEIVRCKDSRILHRPRAVWLPTRRLNWER